MMELGNIIFGNSRGNHPVDRGLQDEFYSYMEEMGFDSYGNNPSAEWAFENEIFRIQPYYWGDCTCGYAERESEWCGANSHGPNCYQIKMRGLDMDKYRPQIDAALEERNRHPWCSPKEDAAQDEVDRLCKLERVHKDKLLKRLCAECGIDWNGGRGCMVHCTCDYRSRWTGFLEANDHASDCPIITPNFLHKPSGFRLDWYKYPLRDSYSSEPLTRKLMRSMFADCIASMPPLPHTDKR
ncbi:hypothetical protein IC614_02825 [Allosphingosinicella flava]|uniref:Uncharacterized protein n=1 Tax=Allosphingosinicella flava TaxID=2771430 RepID=A0A7T2LMW3_9SPHN|nr:hypothetical protein [Sphingosinicella flava]QPQ55552.1 hypothetical protein IC614_02825 [Sphingosinicella flava]